MEKAMIIRKIFQYLDKWTDWSARTAAALTGCIVVFFWFEVVARYFLNSPTNWTASLSLSMMLVSVMLMLPYLSREGHHVAMSFIYEHTPPRFSAGIALCTAGLSSIVCLAAAAICAEEALRQAIVGVRSTDSFMFPLWWLTSFLVYGLSSASLHSARQAFTGAIPRNSEG